MSIAILSWHFYHVPFRKCLFRNIMS